MKIKNKIFITSTSSITCAGNNNSELFDSLCEQKTGIKQISEYSYGTLPALGKINTNNTFYKDLIIQCRNILKDSKLKNFKDTVLIIGSSVGGIDSTENIFFKEERYKNIKPSKHNINAIADILKKEFTFHDDISFSTACTSSANAIGYAYEVLSKGIYKNALVVGLDALCKTTVGGFLSLGVLSSSPSKPFDKQRDGMNVAEAIACLLLETCASDNSVEVCGVGYSSDAYHMTQPHPDGSIVAMLNALKSANIEAEAIDYVNAHGTGTLANDTSEATAINTVFPHKPKVSSTKSITGHTLGAAGAVEAIISCLIIQNQIIPSSTALENAENKDVNFSKQTVVTSVRYVMSNSFAFGGNNCSLIFGKTT